CTKVTRTMAAIILGLTMFDPEVDIRGVILNRTAGGRHQKILRQSIEKYTDVQVLGVLPKLPDNPIPERHMGLISDAEYSRDPFSELAAFLRTHADLEACLNIARQAPAVEMDLAPLYPTSRTLAPVRIGVARDAALWFYYQENFDALRHAGAELVEFSLLADHEIPAVDAVYMGGGFPETLAEGLTQNASMRKSVREHVLGGMPLYAECGGLMYLSRELQYEGVSYPMADVFPLDTKVFKKPQGHGYTSALIASPNPFYPLQARLTGHEFHYSRCVDTSGIDSFVFQIELGQGMAKGHDGVLHRNCLAGYTHMHALGNPLWAGNFVSAARIYRDCRNAGRACPDIRLK
ncbi:MAG: hydrogenobyrinic acid a,c-diamide synthase (glutamine-hydrolyzing), partial [Proteobacteria bacterium]|nr:hydrogenobyrinic acid a,c-diamide synthase (glutamine-hydrolyzing) [Pseudomonadota bacterium]